MKQKVKGRSYSKERVFKLFQSFFWDEYFIFYIFAGKNSRIS